MRSNFLLGTVHLTEAARMALKRQPYDLLCRHAINEHGHITKAEEKANAESLKRLGPIVSRYLVDPMKPKGTKIKITTMADWQDTLIEIDA